MAHVGSRRVRIADRVPNEPGTVAEGPVVLEDIGLHLDETPEGVRRVHDRRAVVPLYPEPGLHSDEAQLRIDLDGDVRNRDLVAKLHCDRLWAYGSARPGHQLAGLPLSKHQTVKVAVAPDEERKYLHSWVGGQIGPPDFADVRD